MRLTPYNEAMNKVSEGNDNEYTLQNYTPR